jgi:hypothetical protein
MRATRPDVVPTMTDPPSWPRRPRSQVPYGACPLVYVNQTSFRRLASRSGASEIEPLGASPGDQRQASAGAPPASSRSAATWSEHWWRSAATQRHRSFWPPIGPTARHPSPRRPFASRTERGWRDSPLRRDALGNVGLSQDSGRHRRRHLLRRVGHRVRIVGRGSVRGEVVARRHVGPSPTSSPPLSAEGGASQTRWGRPIYTSSV